MLKGILKLNGVEKLNNSNLKTINGGANDYYCWDGNGNTFNSSSDVSSSSVHCAIVAVVERSNSAPVGFWVGFGSRRLKNKHFMAPSWEPLVPFIPNSEFSGIF